jgi:hypothetical protein
MQRIIAVFEVLQTSHEPDKAFLVPDSSRATERNGTSIRADVTDDAVENI